MVRTGAGEGTGGSWIKSGESGSGIKISKSLSMRPPTPVAGGSMMEMILKSLRIRPSPEPSKISQRKTFQGKVSCYGA